MRALIAKDWRLFRLPIIGLLVAGVGCLLYTGAFFYFYNFGPNRREHWDNSAILVSVIQNAAHSAGFLTALLASTFGGVAIAGERAERTADFTALLPVTRRQVIMSKFVSAGSVLMVFTLFYALIFIFTFNFSEHLFIRNYPVAIWEWQIGCVISFFGVAWLVSAFTTSAAISACVSIATTMGALAWMSVYMETDRANRYVDVGHRDGNLAMVAFTVGLPCLVAGTIYYLRRTAP